MATTIKKRLKCLNLKEVAPQGWLRRQLEIQMEGLTGQLYQVWDSVGSYTGWLGGTGENWERAPYYLDGLVPLSYYLQDKERWNLACRFVEWTLNSTDSNGNFGPEASKEDYWSRFAMMKVLIQYHEITDDERVLTLFERYFTYLLHELPKRPMEQWSKARIGDLLYCIAWYCEKREADVQELVDLLRSQALDWVELFENFPFVRPADYYYNWKDTLAHFQKEDLDKIMKYHANHIVNLTMGFKYPAMLACFYEDKDYEKTAIKGMEEADRYHGVASGAVNGDEHLAGNDPSRGAELCSIVEYMFSLQTMLEVFGNASFADRLEKLAYNALPATITEDFMAHQYLQQANQVLVSRAERKWFNTNEESNLFGLEPNFGCCTANMHQGWPKFLKSLWYREGTNTIVSMVHAPSKISIDTDDGKWCIEEETEYPFKNHITYYVREAGNSKMHLKIRIPGWCEYFTVKRNNEPGKKCEKKEDFVHIGGLKKGDEIRLELAVSVRKSRWFHNSLAIERGALVYALDIREHWEVLRETAGVKDYAVYPESAWNYALAEEISGEIQEQEVSEVPFSKENPPAVITWKGKRLKSWELEADSAGTLPVSPVESSETEEKLRLIPYGCTKLRVTQFPWYERVTVHVGLRTCCADRMLN